LCVFAKFSIYLSCTNVISLTKQLLLQRHNFFAIISMICFTIYGYISIRLIPFVRWLFIVVCEKRFEFRHQAPSSHWDSTCIIEIIHYDNCLISPVLSFVFSKSSLVTLFPTSIRTSLDDVACHSFLFSSIKSVNSFEKITSDSSISALCCISPPFYLISASVSTESSTFYITGIPFFVIPSKSR
jgi:hypothetical protein